ncbi:uncharacterized protein K441DRAFT_697498 [Cenococcum geophilum 1.58]|uniref:uncharacterized protein n=1 Tax=Cenococcum geophilum 1.58 TaxID=794803 RepID=UPI0035900CF3|nr:hypothetical protein K441DRAFT_697498 [Cenococcum geophilum 1.58]
MSGFEIAGIVLGGLPLIVTALERYADGVHLIKSGIHYETVYLDIQAELVLSMAIFRQCCEQLLRGLLIPDSQFCALVEKQEGWDDPDLIKKMQVRLGDRDYYVYSKFVKRLRKRIYLLAEKLQLQKDLTPVFVVNGVVDHKKEKQFFRNPMTRIKGAFEAEKLKKLVAEIGNDIEKLRDMSLGAIDLEEERHERTSISTSAYWWSLREHALRLFSALSGIWPHTCQSHKHQVNLRVEIPSSQQDESEITPMRLCFCLGSNTVDNVGRDVTIHSSQPPVTPTTSLTPQKKSTRFALPPLTETRYIQNCDSPEKIQDLCTALMGHSQKRCLGFLPVRQWHYHVHDARDWPHSSNLVPLRGLFTGRNRIGVTPRERCVYSAMLARIVMQLFDTPWLGQNWSLEDVYVDGGATNSQFYIPKMFDHAQRSFTHPTKRQAFVKNQMVFALGVALLELTYGKDIRCFKTPEDLDENNEENALTLYSIADRLTKEIQKIETPRFARAVAKCIFPASDTYDFELANEGYRNRFYLDVVQPLQSEYEILFS